MSFPLRPNLIIAGVNKAATTSLFMYLSAHPDVCPAKIKEVQYFLPLRYGAEKLPPIEQYLEYFEQCHGTKYLMEATGGYYYGGAAVAEAIKSHLNDARIIIIFRDPIDRLFSFYKFKKSTLELDPSISFEAYIRLCECLPATERKKRENNLYWGIEGGFYADYLEAWFDAFGEEAVKVLFFDDLKRDTRGVLRGLCQWLGLEHEAFISNLELSVENKSVNYKYRTLQKIGLAVNWYGESFWRSHPSIKKTLRRIYYSLNGTSHKSDIAEDTRAYLEQVFGPYNRRLAIQLTKYGYIDLPQWLKREVKALDAESIK